MKNERGITNEHCPSCGYLLKEHTKEEDARCMESFLATDALIQKVIEKIVKKR